MMVEVIFFSLNQNSSFFVIFNLLNRLLIYFLDLSTIITQSGRSQFTIIEIEDNEVCEYSETTELNFLDNENVHH